MPTNTIEGLANNSKPKRLIRTLEMRVLRAINFLRSDKEQVHQVETWSPGCGDVE